MHENRQCCWSWNSTDARRKGVGLSLLSQTLSDDSYPAFRSGKKKETPECCLLTTIDAIASRKGIGMSYPTRKKLFEPTPLRWTSRRSAVDLLKESFPNQTLLEKASSGLSLSLMPKWVSAVQQSFSGICNCRYWCITAGEKVIGLTGIYQRKHDQPNTVWLGKTCIAFDFQGHGLGTYLIDFAIQQSTEAGMNRLNVYVARNNRRAIRFYQRCGFRKISADEPANAARLIYLGMDIAKSSINTSASRKRAA